MLQTENCGASRIKEIVCEDRISALPQDLLVMILDLVPTKDAVATMFLSKRWRSVWTMKQRLEYKDSEEEEEDSDSDRDSDTDTDSDSDDDDEEEHVDSDDDDDEEEHVDSDDDDEEEHVDSDDDDDVDNEHEHKEDDVDDDNENKNEENAEEVESKKSVWLFLDKSLQLHKAPVIESLCMELGRRCPTDVDIGNLVSNALDRWVLEMKFKLLWSADPASLPKSLYSCESLMTLTLSHKILVDVPSSAFFPSMTTLNLHYVVYKDDDSLVRLLSSCPVLENLFVKRNNNDDNVTRFSVESPSLLYFTYDNYRRPPTDNDVGDTGRCLVVDIPTATYFEIYDSSGDSCSIEMPYLDIAYIDTHSSPDDKFLRSLSSVWSLVLYLADEMVVCCRTIKFSWLTVCTICPEKSDWMEPTILLLGNSPKLKSLTIDYECTYEPEDLPLSWNQPSSVPMCVSSQLECFEWKEYGGREEEKEFLTYVLAKAKSLKTAIISLGSTFDQQMMMEALKDIPRVSTESELVVKS